MTDALAGPVASFPLKREILDRNRPLALYGAALLVLAVPVAMMPAIDPRLLDTGLTPWLKPAKFLVSIGVFALTAAWFTGYVRPDRRDSARMRWTTRVLIGSATFELFWITWQAAHGVDSHFNTSTAVNTAMFSLMGLGALLLTATTLPLAYEIARRPVPGLSLDYRIAVVAALGLTWLLGTAAGVVMSVNGSHAVGPEGARLPLLGWNRVGGDLRVAHFLGLHAEQLIPAGAVLISGLAAPPRLRLVIGGLVAYTAFAVAVFAQALAGRPLLPLN